MTIDGGAFIGVRHRLEAAWYLLMAFVIAVVGHAEWAVVLLVWHIGMTAILRDREDGAGTESRAQATADRALGVKVRLSIADIHDRQKFCGDRVRIECCWREGGGADRVEIMVASAPERGCRL